MSLLRFVLENSQSSPDPEQQASIIMKGPLSDIYTKALDMVYAKDNPEEMASNPAVQPVLESQAMDVVLLQKLSERMTHGAEPTGPVNTVYGVAKNDLNDEVMVEVTSELAAAQADDRDFILIIDATMPGANSEAAGTPVERLEKFDQALECMVVAHGQQVYRSLKAFAESK